MGTKLKSAGRFAAATLLVVMAAILAFSSERPDWGFKLAELDDRDHVHPTFLAVFGEANSSQNRLYRRVDSIGLGIVGGSPDLVEAAVEDYAAMSELSGLPISINEITDSGSINAIVYFSGEAEYKRVGRDLFGDTFPRVDPFNGEQPCESEVRSNDRYELVMSVILVNTDADPESVRRCIATGALLMIGLRMVSNSDDGGLLSSPIGNGNARLSPFDTTAVSALYSSGVQPGMTADQVIETLKNTGFLD